MSLMLVLFVTAGCESLRNNLIESRCFRENYEEVSIDMTYEERDKARIFNCSHAFACEIEKYNKMKDWCEKNNEPS